MKGNGPQKKKKGDIINIFFFYFRNWYFCRASIFPARNSEGKKKKKFIEVIGVGQRSLQVKIKESNKSNFKKIVLIG